MRVVILPLDKYNDEDPILSDTIVVTAYPVPQSYVEIYKSK